MKADDIFQNINVPGLRDIPRVPHVIVRLCPNGRSDTGEYPRQNHRPKRFEACGHRALRHVRRTEPRDLRLPAHLTLIMS